MNGLKTIVTVGLVELYALLASQGIIIPENDQSAYTAAVLAAVFALLRHFTNGKPPWRS